MVCIIDDREDVWKFAPNLITVKKYVYFQGTGDINAPPGSREAQIKNRGNLCLLICIKYLFCEPVGPLVYSGCFL